MTDPDAAPGTPSPEESPEAASIDEILARHLPALQAFVRLRAGPGVAAKESMSDLVQSVCRELLEGRSRFEFQGDAAFKSWLYTTALRKIVEKDRYYRAGKRDMGKEIAAAGHGEEGEGDLMSQYATLATPSRDLAVKEQMAQVEQAFDKLTEEHREVVTLAKIVGLPHAEIARTMGRTEEATRQLLRRALVQLARHMETSDEQP